MAIVIPNFPEDRGPFFVDPTTGSTLAKPSAYCRDLKGCGDQNYLFLSQSMNINGRDDDCVRLLLASASVKIILYGPEVTSVDIGTVMEYIQNQLEASFVACPAA